MSKSNPKQLAGAFACAVTVSSDDSMDWVARNGEQSLFRTLERILPEISQPSGKRHRFKGKITCSEFNKTLQNGFGFIRGRTRKVALSKAAGNWLFCRRRWLNPDISEEKKKLECGYEKLCQAFTSFANCSKDHFLNCLAEVSTNWESQTKEASTTFKGTSITCSEKFFKDQKIVSKDTDNFSEEISFSPTPTDQKSMFRQPIPVQMKVEETDGVVHMLLSSSSSAPPTTSEGHDAITEAHPPVAIMAELNVKPEPNREDSIQTHISDELQKTAEAKQKFQAPIAPADALANLFFLSSIPSAIPAVIPQEEVATLASPAGVVAEVTVDTAVPTAAAPTDVEIMISALILPAALHPVALLTMDSPPADSSCTADSPVTVVMSEVSGNAAAASKACCKADFDAGVWSEIMVDEEEGDDEELEEIDAIDVNLTKLDFHMFTECF